MIGVGQVASNGFRSLYSALPGDVVAAPARAPIHAEPETDPIDEAHMAGFSQGFEEGYRAAGEDQANEIEARNLTDIVDIVFVSDHGMTDTSHPELIFIDDAWSGWLACRSTNARITA